MTKYIIFAAILSMLNRHLLSRLESCCKKILNYVSTKTRADVYKVVREREKEREN